MFQIKKGLDLPISGQVEQKIEQALPARSVAVLGEDYYGMRPTMLVAEGDRVKLGQLLFSDKKNPGVHFTAPGAGLISAINRGQKRALISVVIELDGEEAIEFEKFPSETLATVNRARIVENLVASGLWPALRTRPFSRVPSPEAAAPHSVFVTAMDTNPLAVDPAIVIGEHAQAFSDGIMLLAKLTEGAVHVCAAAGAPLSAVSETRAKISEFSGPHPAGLVGTHIHHLDPVSAGKTVWHIGYQDVIAVGELFTTGRLPVRRIISLAGPGVENPRILETRTGASLDELTAGQLNSGENRVISGSVLSGAQAFGARAFLGRYHNQVSVLPEGREKEFLGWALPGKDKFSATRAYTGHLQSRQEYAMSTTTGGSPRAMVPIGVYERVMPLDILATPLLKALIVMDTDNAQSLGCLELDEEDLALCTFVCPGKYEYGAILRENLDQIEKEG